MTIVLSQRIGPFNNLYFQWTIESSNDVSIIDSTIKDHVVPKGAAICILTVRSDERDFGRRRHRDAGDAGQLSDRNWRRILHD